MSRTAKHLFNMEIDEISLVDAPAAQHGRVVIAKRADEEDNVPEYFDQSGNALDDSALSGLEEGDVVFDTDGNAFVAELESEESEEMELETVGKSLGDEIRESLAKSLTDVQRDEVISKAAEQVAAAEARAAAAEEIAKSERTIRLEREYISKAAEYNVPIEAAELGPVLMRMAETMAYEDCAVIHKALESAGAALFDEVGSIGGNDNADPMAMVDAIVSEQVSKADGSKISKAEATAEYFEQNPAAYDEWLTSRGN